MINHKPPVDQEREPIRRWLLLYFATYGREGQILARASEIERLVRSQHTGHLGVDAESLAIEAGAREFSRAQKSDDDRLRELKVAPIELVLQAAKDNMKDFDHSHPIEPASTAILIGIDPEISGADGAKDYFTKFSGKMLYQQTAILEKLIAASISLADVYDFTGTIFDLLRNSPAYEPMVHGKAQRGFLRIERPPKEKGRPRTCGNDMFLSLVRSVSDAFNVSAGAAAKTVQVVMSEVLDYVRGPDGSTKRHAFRPSDSAVKSLLRSMN